MGFFYRFHFSNAHGLMKKINWKRKNVIPHFLNPFLIKVGQYVVIFWFSFYMTHPTCHTPRRTTSAGLSLLYTAGVTWSSDVKHQSIDLPEGTFTLGFVYSRSYQFGHPGVSDSTSRTWSEVPIPKTTSRDIYSFKTNVLWYCYT